MNDVTNINLWRLGQEITKYAQHPGITREELEATYRCLIALPAWPETIEPFSRGFRVEAYSLALEIRKEI